MKNKFLRWTFCLVSACSLFALSGCSTIIATLLKDDSSSSKSYAEDEWNPGEDALTSLSPSDEGQDSELSYDAPDEDKEVLRSETDAIGHKIVYYTDGTCEDLGRVIPIDFQPQDPAQKEGYQYLATQHKAQGLCDFYEEILTVARNFHTSDKNVTKTDDYYEIANMRFSQHGLTSGEAVSVWRTVSIEYPEFFWWGNSVLLGSTSLTFLIDPLYAQASVRQEAQTAIERMANDCDAYIDGTTTETERALTVHDYVTDLIEYAYETDGYTPEDDIWAHNIAGGALYGKGVCETYAKTYDYLCEKFEINCITVAGYAVENGERFGHAWNVVQIDDGWYNVDATWNDLDASTLTREWFGANPDEFSQSHDAFTPQDGWNVNYMFATPTLNEDGLTPVRAATAQEFNNGKYTADNAPMYPSLKAVSALIDEGETYQAYLYPKTSATGAQTNVEQIGAVFHGAIHTSGTLEIVGSYRSLLGGYFEIAELISKKDVTLTGDIILRDLSYQTPSLNLGGKTLTTKGTAVEIVAETTIQNGNLTDQTTEWTEILGEVNVDEVRAQGTEFCFLDGGTIANGYVYGETTLRFCGDANVTIGSLWYQTSNARLYLDEASSTTKITIGEICTQIVGDETLISNAEKMTIFVRYSSADDYPAIQLEKINSDAYLYLRLSNDYANPKYLGKAFIRLGGDVPLSKMRIGYTWLGMEREFSQSNYEKQANGDVCCK